MEFSPILLWFVLGLILVLSEFVLPGVILVFFGIGAWITTLTVWWGWTGGWTSQLLTFAISSVVLLVVLRGWLKGPLLRPRRRSARPPSTTSIRWPATPCR